MKKILFVLCFLSGKALSQSNNIALAKKISDPVILSSGDTLKVDQVITIKMGSSPNGDFKYVRLLNSFNEPIKPADSRSAMKKQNIRFFKVQDGTTYVFTKFFVINIEAAIESKEAALK